MGSKLSGAFYKPFRLSDMTAEEHLSLPIAPPKPKRGRPRKVPLESSGHCSSQGSGKKVCSADRVPEESLRCIPPVQISKGARATMRQASATTFDRYTYGEFEKVNPLLSSLTKNIHENFRSVAKIEFEINALMDRLIAYTEMIVKQRSVSTYQRKNSDIYHQSALEKDTQISAKDYWTSQAALLGHLSNLSENKEFQGAATQSNIASMLPDAFEQCDELENQIEALFDKKVSILSSLKTMSDTLRKT